MFCMSKTDSAILQLIDRAWYQNATSCVLTKSWFPRRCYETKKSLWLKPAYKITHRFASYGGDFTEVRWVEQQHYVIMKLKGDA